LAAFTHYGLIKKSAGTGTSVIAGNLGNYAPCSAGSGQRHAALSRQWRQLLHECHLGDQQRGDRWISKRVFTECSHRDCRLPERPGWRHVLVTNGTIIAGGEHTLTFPGAISMGLVAASAANTTIYPITAPQCQRPG